MPAFAPLSPRLRAVLQRADVRRCTLDMLALIAAFALLGVAAPTLAKPPQNDAGASHREARDDAARHLPLSRLNVRDRSRVMSVVNDTAIFRRLPSQMIPCDATMYQFLVDHPDVVVNLWKVLGISEVSLRRTGANTFATDDGQGTAGTIEVLYQAPDVMLALADGTYEGALFTRKVSGKCVLLLRNDYTRGKDGRNYVTCRLDSFIQIQNVGAELVVRTFQPLVGHFADHNFRETANFIATLNHAAEVNPGKVEQLAEKMNDIHPNVRGRFIDLTHQIAARVARVDESVDVRPPELARRPTANAPTKRQ